MQSIGPESMHNIIVTGAGKGLGRAIAHQLLGEGARVYAVEREEALLSSLNAEFGSRVECCQVDVTDYGAIEKLYRSLADVPLFGLVNNAGTLLGKGLFEYSPEEVARVIDVNLKGAIYFSKFFGHALLGRKAEGCIVNLSSSSIYGGGDPVYSATKAALVGLTKSCALKFAPYIRVNAVAPGIVETDLLVAVSAEAIQRYRQAELVKKPLRPQDVAKTVSFLMSEAGRNYTGALFDLNNGFHM
jgi:3-oxoacyl-[acyl-carrier protein] reductase